MPRVPVHYQRLCSYFAGGVAGQTAGESSLTSRAYSSTRIKFAPRNTQKDMCRAFAPDVLRAFITQGTHIDAVHSRYAATNADVAPARCGPRLLQGSVNAFGDELKLRTSRHAERRSRVMGQDEDGRVIRRFLAPLGQVIRCDRGLPNW